VTLHALGSLGNAVRLVPPHSGVVVSGHLEQISSSSFLPLIVSQILPVILHALHLYVALFPRRRR
jgi:hypothetical protein